LLVTGEGGGVKWLWGFDYDLFSEFATVHDSIRRAISFVRVFFSGVMLPVQKQASKSSSAMNASAISSFVEKNLSRELAIVRRQASSKQNGLVLVNKEGFNDSVVASC